MPPAIRRGGRGKGPITTHNDHEAGPLHMRAPASTMSADPQRNRRNLFEPARRYISHSLTPSCRHTFGPNSENEPDNPQPSFIPLQRSVSHRSFGDHTPVFQGRFNPANYVQEPVGFNPLGPEDHFSEDNAMDMDEDTDPVEPARGTPNHPIEISDGSSFHGTPYQGPDSYQARFNQCEWYFTPSHHLSPHEQQQQDPSEDSRFVAVTPPPPPLPVHQAPSDPPRRRRTGARISARRWDFHFSTPRHSSGSHYPPLHEDPQMGGPSNPAAEVNSAPVAPPPPPFGYDNPIPTYAGSTAYNPFEQPAHTHYNYIGVDPYIEAAANYHALHPEVPYETPWGMGYSTHGYPIPARPPAQHLSQQPRFSPPEQEEILHRLNMVERDFEEERKNNRGFLKGLANLLKGKKKRDH
ncbi:hypothetical protein HanXRQr2_Chr13g0583721 [Helianthus annuus]|uniref:Uncharacterized protein n=1 Tax=Helianthus annuus TaxID=4232 RepID=A0A9K3EG47_HELAN|nr:hypothetical protein HanXRQr2_Chr13g0583721 [Helianthus annuus]KAJ0848815.1 hypothetical protein HanPSC8_Chr13g0561891 [Helianthus annuus]